MSIFKFLGLQGVETPREAETGDTATVRRIVEQLDHMDPERARFIAAFAFVLARVANADLEISEDETRLMEAIVREIGGLEAEQAILVVQMAKSHNRLFGATEDFLVTREFRAIADRDDKERLLHCLFAVAAADDTITTAEDERVRQIATELGVGHQDFVEIRSHYSDKREVIKKLREQRSR
jgi:uncharacterized tellurite resistance protein B-like protein